MKSVLFSVSFLSTALGLSACAAPAPNASPASSEMQAAVAPSACPDDPAPTAMLDLFRDHWSDVTLHAPPDARPVSLLSVLESRTYQRESILTWGDGGVGSEAAAFARAEAPAVLPHRNTLRQVYFDASGRLVDIVELGNGASFVFPGAVGTPDDFTFETAAIGDFSASEETCRTLGAPDANGAAPFLICRVILGHGYNYQILRHVFDNGVVASDCGKP